MAELKTRDLKGVEILDVGTWDASTGPFTVTEDDIDAYIANFEAVKDVLKVPAKLGHDEGQRLLQQDGYPAAGWLERLYKVGTKLVGDFAKVPDKVADLVEAGGYRKTSAEIWHDVTVGAQKFAKLLMGVAFLGEEVPAVTTLDDILELYGAKAAFSIGPTSKVQTVVIERKAARAPSKHGALRAQVADAFRRFRDLLAQDVSQENIRQELQDAVDARFGGGLDGGYPWIVETYDDHVIVARGADYWSVPYIRADNGDITFDDPVPVVQTWVPKTGDPSGSLPANTPSAEGSGVSTPPPTQAKKKEDDMADLKRIASALGLADGAGEEHILAKIKEFGTAKTELEQLRTTVTELSADKKDREAKDLVVQAIRAGKVAPAQREWAETYAAADAKGFATYVEKTPVLFAREKGSATDVPETKGAAAQISERIAAAMKADPKLTFKTALDTVARENPDLAKRAVDERRAPAMATA